MFAEAPGVVEVAGFDAWQAHANRQVLALASAVDDQSPEIFSSRLAWSRDAFAARQTSDDGLVLELNCLETVLEESLPRHAWEILPEYFRHAREALDLGHARASDGTEVESPRSQLAQRYLDALESGDEPRAVGLVQAALAAGELTVPDLIESVLVPVQRELGRRWHLGSLSVSDEHFGTQVTRRVLSLALARAPRARPRQRTVVIAALAGDAHDLALSFVAAHFDLDGWRTLYLGADTPIPDLVSFAARHRADLVALGATLDEQRVATAEAVRALREACPNVRVLVGGSAYTTRPDLWRRTGADDCASDGPEAVRKGLALVGG